MPLREQLSQLSAAGLFLSPVLLIYEGAGLLSRIPIVLDEHGAGRTKQGGAAWQVQMTATIVNTGTADLSCTFTVTEGAARQMAVGLALTCAEWSVDNYLLLPGAAYNGNRFDARIQDYPPMFVGEDRRPVPPATPGA